MIYPLPQILRSATTTEPHYRPKKNITILMEKPREIYDSEEDDESGGDEREMKETLLGLVILSLTTNKGEMGVISVDY